MCVSTVKMLPSLSGLAHGNAAESTGTLGVKRKVAELAKHEDDEEEETLQDYGYNPTRDASYPSVEEAIGALFGRPANASYATMAAPLHTIVVNKELMIKFKLSMRYQPDGHDHPTLIITHAAVAGNRRRTGVFTAAVNDLIHLLEPQFVMIEAVLPLGGMPEWAAKNGYEDDYGSGNWIKNLM